MSRKYHSPMRIKRKNSRTRKTPCRSGKIRDVTSGRCRSKKSSGRKRKSPSRKSIKPCRPDQVRNRSTGRKRKSPSRKSIKPCRPDQVRNRSTGRCRKSKKLSANAYATRNDKDEWSRVTFEPKFRKTMYDNMWNFMNTDMIKSMYGFKISYQRDDNDIFTDDHKNTICFKGDPDPSDPDNDDGGHYVFVDGNLIAHGSYESELLAYDSDDGICHGVAIAFALNFIKGRADMFLKEFPTTVEDYKYNYKTILTVYIEIIENGKWDKALLANFYGDVKWIKRNKKNTTKETQTALRTLKAYIKRFD